MKAEELNREEIALLKDIILGRKVPCILTASYVAHDLRCSYEVEIHVKQS